MLFWEIGRRFLPVATGARTRVFTEKRESVGTWTEQKMGGPKWDREPRKDVSCNIVGQRVTAASVAKLTSLALIRSASAHRGIRNRQKPGLVGAWRPHTRHV